MFRKTNVRLVQRRREMMESLLLRGVVSLGSRAAAAVEYLPVLRDICRTEQLKEKGKIKRRWAATFILVFV